MKSNNLAQRLKNNGKRDWRKLIMALAVLTVFLSTYVMILPAFTLDEKEALKQGGIDLHKLQSDLQGSSGAFKSNNPGLGMSKNSTSNTALGSGLTAKDNNGSGAEGSGDSSANDGVGSSAKSSGSDSLQNEGSGKTSGSDQSDSSAKSSDSDNTDSSDKTESSGKPSGSDKNAKTEKNGGADKSADSNKSKDSDETDGADKADNSADSDKVESSADSEDVIKTLTKTKELEFAGKGYTLSAVCDVDTKLPQDTEIEVEEILKNNQDYDDYYQKALDAIQKEDAKSDDYQTISVAKFYDISLISDGENIEPESPVNVTIEYDNNRELDISDKKDLRIVHFTEENGNLTAEVLDNKENNIEATIKNSELSETSFDAEGFSVYAVVGVETIETTVLTADGKTLKVSVSLDSREAIGKDAKLKVSEVTSEDDPKDYASRNERLAGALFDEYGNVAITDARYLDISIMVPDKAAGEGEQAWKEYEPVYPVKVKIGYSDPMDTTNPGEYKDYNDGATKVTPDIGHHIVAVHYSEDGAEILETSDVNTNEGVSETVTHTDGFSEYDLAYIYEYEVIDAEYDSDLSPIKVTAPKMNAVAKAAPSGLLRGAGDAPAHTKTLGDNNDGTHKLSLTVTGDADTDNNTASNANVIIVFDTSNSMINYYVPMQYGARGSNNADGSNSFVLYSNTNGTEATDGYTGTVYTRTRYGGRYYYSEYTGQRYSKTIRRADAAEKVLYDFTHALYGYQNENDPSTPVDESQNIQTALITFNEGANTRQNWTSSETDMVGTQNNQKVSWTGEGGSKKIPNASGTNWEDALRQAQTVMRTADNDPTFVVFITDGQPTQWHDHTSGYDTSGQGYVEARDEARAIQVACEATGTDSHGALFGIYAYGTEADYLDELMYYAYTGTARTMNPGTVPAEGYYNAADSASLTEAINDIFSKIVKTLGITAVSISDGTTSKVQTTTGDISHLLEVDTSTYEYWLSLNTIDNKFTMKDLVSGDDIEYTVSSSGNNVTISWTKDGNNYSETYEGTYSAGKARIKWDRGTSFYNYTPPTATFTDPRVDWDLSRVGTLLDGVTYEVTFDVYPSQYTLDLIADLKNGYKEYDSLDDNIKTYLLKTEDDYILATNTNASISYTDTRTDEGPQSSGYTNPDPVETSATDVVTVSKDWSNDVDDRTRPDELLMHVTRDGTDRYELLLNDGDHWTDSAFISFGLVTIHNGVVAVKTTGHDYSFSEPPHMEYYWELIAPTLRPMKINGVDTMLVKVDASEAPSMSGDNATAIGDDGYTYYKFTIDGTAMYYKVDNSIASLHAENHRRSYLQVMKNVENPKDGDEFDFTINVTNGNASNGSEGDINSDYYVWFSVYDTKGGSTVISDDLATGEGLQRETNNSGDYTGYYYIPSGNDVTIKMQDGYSLRFLNLPIGSTYAVSETLDGNYENVSIEGKRKYKEKTEGEGGSEVVVDKSEDTGRVSGLGISGTIDYADSRYEIDYTNERIVTEASAKKEWKNADGTTTAPQGGKVTYTLYADGTATNYKVTLDGTADEEPEDIGGYEIEGWTAKFVNLSKYKIVNGEKVPIKYTIAETETYPGYTASTTDPVADGGTITNTQEATQANALKAWKNANGSTTAPDGATVVYTLYADGTATNYTVTLDGTADTAPERTGGYESEAWKAEFVKLPKYKAGTTTEIVYTIAETETYPGYTASTTDPVASGETITNEQGSTETYAEKAWKNADGSVTAPTDGIVVFTLYADGEKTDYEVTLDGTADTAPTSTGGYESEAWKAEFVKLPKYKAGTTTEIVYTIAETTGYPGYTADTTEPVGSGSTITNSQDPTTANALKAWKNADGTTAAPQGGQVTYTLYADGTATNYTVTLDGTAETAPEVAGGYESEAWKAEFINLPKYKIVDDEAVEIVYTIAETTAYPGYTASTTDPVASGQTITNTQEPTEANALKAWKNADGSTTPPKDATVEFTLYADGAATEHKVTLDGTPDETVPTNTGGYENEEWKALFVNLPKYKVVEGEAVEIVYTIGESEGYAGYAATPEDPVASGETITNAQVDTEAYAVKAWLNADGSTTAPDGGTVVFTLYADGEATEYKVTLDGTPDETVPTVTGGYESEAWKASFVNLPKYQEDGTTEIVYTIAETTGYEGYKVSTSEPVESGMGITNSQISAEIKLKKIGDGDTGNTLDNAVFELYSTWKGADSAENVKAKDIHGNEIGTITTAGGGLATIGKLLPGTYYLVETMAPDGYNMIEGPVEIYIQLREEDPGFTVSYSQTGYSNGSDGAGMLSPDDDGAYLITVSDPSGVELPHTGGLGTTWIYLLGSLLLVGCSIILVTRRRMNSIR